MTMILPPDPVDRLSDDEFGSLLRDMSRQPHRMNPQANGRPLEDAPRPRFSLLTDFDIEMMPAPSFLVADTLTRGGLSALVGPPGCGKSFLALDWGACVARGMPWGDSEVQRGPVVFVAAEGSAGLGVRLRAWKASRHVVGAVGMHFITEPVSLLNAADVGGFLRAIEALPEPPALVVLDTLARCMVGGDENSTQEMSAFIAGADRIRTITGATVLILHHMNAGGERERGNTALRGAVDTMMFLKAEGDQLTLSCEKQKDAAPFDKLHLQLMPTLESCVLVTANRGLQLQSDELTPKQVEILALLQTHFLPSGATATEWLKAAGIVERTFYNYRTLLVKKGYVSPPDNPRGGRYSLTSAGESLLTASCNDTANSLNCSDPKSLHASRGGLEDPLHCSDGLHPHRNGR